MSGDSKRGHVMSADSKTLRIMLPSGIDVEYSLRASSPGVLRMESEDWSPPFPVVLSVDDVTWLASFLSWLRDGHHAIREEIDWDALFAEERK